MKKLIISILFAKIISSISFAEITFLGSGGIFTDKGTMFGTSMEIHNNNLSISFNILSSPPSITFATFTNYNEDSYGLITGSNILTFFVVPYRQKRILKSYEGFYIKYGLGIAYNWVIKEVYNLSPYHAMPILSIEKRFNN